MGSVLPKQFMEIDGRALIFYTLEKFLEFDNDIEMILVLNDGYFDYWDKLRIIEGFEYPVKVAPGGITRFHSVKSGIKCLEGASIVGIHDSVRPLVSVSCIERAYNEAGISGCAIPCIPLNDSVREINGEESRAVDRGQLTLVQTPQAFRSDILRKAYNTSYKESFTDDASVVERAGYDIKIVPGDEFNFKITTPGDFEIARMLLTPQKPHLH